MDGERRRKQIVANLSNATRAVSATKLSQEFGVSRQVIVGDIALLRAGGQEIIATSRGYILEGKREGIVKTIASKHGTDQTYEELEAIVKLGGEVLDVSVEHPLYGEITGNLHIKTRADAREFCEAQENNQATLLSDLTGGIHTHKLLVRDEIHFAEIEKVLREKGLLYTGIA
ncbi:MAG: transcription repressor NadR [Lactobacillales bacterium]|jgi:transcriptional regulator of NAD metabolism|nr:transcription repressor NadR [Lactobacillales bacterium]